MLKYLIIVLDNTSVSFCHYETTSRPHFLISIDTLKKAISFGMKQNLMIQFIYPEYELPDEYLTVIDSIDHIKIKPQSIAQKNDISVSTIESIDDCISNNMIVVRGSINEFFNNTGKILDSLYKNNRTNIVLTGLDNATDKDIELYSKFLVALVDFIVAQYKLGKNIPQVNILTDRLTLESMNNCNAGSESITIAPNGQFYICPAFYYDEEKNVDVINSDLYIPNNELYKLDHAPICRICDAYQCHRCVWLNKRKTLEVNTPSKIQCIIAHLERNASLSLLTKLRELGPFMHGINIPKIDYLDPFEKINY